MPLANKSLISLLAHNAPKITATFKPNMAAFYLEEEKQFRWKLWGLQQLTFRQPGFTKAAAGRGAGPKGVPPPTTPTPQPGTGFFFFFCYNDHQNKRKKYIRQPSDIG